MVKFRLAELFSVKLSAAVCEIWNILAFPVGLDVFLIDKSPETWSEREGCFHQSGVSSAYLLEYAHCSVKRLIF